MPHPRRMDMDMNMGMMSKDEMPGHHGSWNDDDSMDREEGGEDRNWPVLPPPPPRFMDHRHVHQHHLVPPVPSISPLLLRFFLWQCRECALEFLGLHRGFWQGMGAAGAGGYNGDQLSRIISQVIPFISCSASAKMGPMAMGPGMGSMMTMDRGMMDPMGMKRGMMDPMGMKRGMMDPMGMGRGMNRRMGSMAMMHGMRPTDHWGYRGF